MQRFGIGAEGNIIKDVTVSATLPAAPGTPGTAIGYFSLRDIDSFSLQLISTGLAGGFTGTWLVEASNNYSPAAGGTNYNQPPNAGTWSDVSALFTPTLTTALSTNTVQLVQPLTVPNGWRDLRVSLTRTGGTSVVINVWVFGKGR